VGTKERFIDDASLIFSTKNKSADYHDNMNAELYEKWFEEKVLPGLTEPTIIILNNARYHSRMVETRPSSSWTKLKISEWLQNRNIDFDPDSLKCELLEISKKYPLTKEYVVDHLVLQYGHVVLRLPPYHCQLNPIEMVWGIAKNYYDKNIIKYSGKDEEVLNVWTEALNQITPEVWSNCVCHVEKLIVEAYKKEVILDEVRPLIISLEEEDSDECYSDSDDEN
jgi:transposase